MKQTEAAAGIPSVRADCTVPQKKETKKALGRGTWYVLLPVIILIVWELVCHYGNVMSYSMPAPEVILQDAVEKIQSGVLWKHIAVSFVRVLEGFLLALVSALFLGILIGLSRPVERFTELGIEVKIAEK